MSQAFDIVITSGGIGPTHDDVTLKAIASALGQEITVSREMMEHLEDVHSEKAEAAAAMDESMKRLALLPEHSTLLWVPDADSHPPPPPPSPPADAATAAVPAPGRLRRRSSKEWPVLRCDNIYVLPGIPAFFANKMSLITKHFLKTSNHALVQHRIVLDVEESKIVELLDGLVARHPEVKFGSYPFVDHPEFKTIISVESRGGPNACTVDDAVQSLLTEVSHAHGPKSVLRVERGRGAGNNH
jgi:FAD synthetase